MLLNKLLQQPFAAPFDSIAGLYDEVFTNTPLGRRKRTLVHRYLSRILQKDWNVLELNYGTGEDALWMSKHVNHITATDVSEKMLKQGQEKLRRENTQNVEFAQMRIEDLWEGNRTTIPFTSKQDFDLIFSNFDGFNCLKDFSPFPSAVHSLLTPNGDLVVVLMSKFCLIERLGWSFRGQFGRAFSRRRKSGINVHIGEGISVTTYFHSTITILQLCRMAGFRVKAIKAIGLLIPPTSMRDFYGRHIGIFQRFEMIEDNLDSIYPLNRMGNHIIIHLKRIK